MTDLPRGTVTLVFTDIEGSTRLLQEQPDDYAIELAEHRRRVRDACARHGGVEVDTQGDAFFVAFSRASDAVAAADAIQRTVQAGRLKVRIGIHTGEPIASEGGYTGIDVHRAARIAAAGHGGQTLLSQSTRDLVVGVEVKDLGLHRLKDLANPERIYQLGEGEFPELRSQREVHLPLQPTTVIGRRREMAELNALLSQGDVRLITLTGAGGSGKTRLAIEAAAAAADLFERGVWWVPLSNLVRSEDVVPALHRALSGSPIDALGGGRMLIVLDNFEHVMAAAPDTAGLIATAAHITVLATSRERLAIQGEHVYLVPVLTREESRQLFEKRAHSGVPAAASNPMLEELCARLDDLPLAIELAAARTSLLTVDQLLQRLGGRLDLLRAGRDAEKRHQTLRATMEWSYELLNQDEQRLFASLSVFRGGWTIDSAEVVAGASLEALESLLDKSLISRLPSGRFTMLETVRDFGAERLDQASQDRLLHKLLDYLGNLFAEANLSEDPTGPPQMDLANAERPNMDSALAWATRSGAVARALELLVATEMFWITTDPVGGRTWLDGLMARLNETDQSLDAGRHARAVRFRGATFDMVNRYDLAEVEFARASELFRAGGEEAQMISLQARIANSALRQGDLERAISLATESLEVARRRGFVADEGYALFVLAMAAFQQGDVALGTRLAHESAPLTLRGGFPWISGTSLLATAEHLIAAGEVDQAEPDLRQGLTTLASVSDRVNIPYALGAAAAIAALRAQRDRAGVLWGALERLAEREPRSTTQDAIRDNTPYIAGTQGPEFENGRSRGRLLSFDEAVEYALSSPGQPAKR